jgi:hypothetical protein
MEKRYHFYIDEGGMFGLCEYGISNKKCKGNGLYSEDYYIGYMTIQGITRHLQLFHYVFPKCLIIKNTRLKIEINYE